MTQADEDVHLNWRAHCNGRAVGDVSRDLDILISTDVWGTYYYLSVPGFCSQVV